jgi:anti-sigma factor RsiW
VGKKPGLNARATERRKRAVSSVTCAQAVALLAGYISGEMKAADRLAFESHQHTCPDCVAFMQTYRKTIELTRSFLRLRAAPQSPRLSLGR